MSSLRSSSKERAAVLALCAGISLAVFAVFLPALSNGFVNWDDGELVLRNPHIQGLGWARLRWMASSEYMSSYQPLGWLAYALIHHVQGFDPFGFHLANVVVHCVNAGLLFLLGFNLLSAAWPGVRARDRLCGAAIAALLHGLHPLQAQDVAWVSTLADLLASSFFLASLLACLEAMRREGTARTAWEAGALAAFVLSVLCRWKGVHLPVALVCLHGLGLRKRRFDSRDRLVLGVFAAIAASAVAVNAHSKMSQVHYAFSWRPLEAAGGILGCVRDILWPVGLVNLREVMRGQGLDAWLPLLLGTCLTAGLIVERRRWPEGLAAWACFLGGVAPTFSLSAAEPVFIKVQQAYLSTMPLYLLVGAGFVRLVLRPGRSTSALRPAALGTAAAAACWLTLLSQGQLRVWGDSVSLWTYTLAMDPDSHPARANLAVALIDQGRYEEAFVHLTEQLRRHPDDGVARFDLDAILSQAGKVKPDPLHFHNNFGADLYRAGLAGEAVQHFAKALSLAPASADTHANMGRALLRFGKSAEAARHFQAAEAIERRSRPLTPKGRKRP